MIATIRVTEVLTECSEFRTRAQVEFLSYEHKGQKGDYLILAAVRVGDILLVEYTHPPGHPLGECHPLKRREAGLAE